MNQCVRAYLDTLCSFEPNQYEGLSTTDLMVYVAKTLEKSGVQLSFELLVVGAYRLFPEAFSLGGFREYPDASRVGRTLLQCRPKYRNLMDGKGSTQFVLTEQGHFRAAEVDSRLKSGVKNARMARARRGAPRFILDRLEAEISDSHAFQSWLSNQPISEYDFYHLLHLLPGSSTRAVQENYSQIRGIVQEGSNQQIRDFLGTLETQFSKELSQ